MYNELSTFIGTKLQYLPYDKDLSWQGSSVYCTSQAHRPGRWWAWNTPQSPLEFLLMVVQFVLVVQIFSIPA